MKGRIVFIVSILFVSLIFTLFKSTVVIAQDAGQKIYSFEPGDKIPVDPSVTIGKLNNGLTYYIRENHKPEKRAELRLVVKAGSILEDEDQLGLAHLTEHMAFDGTKNFKKQALVDYLESIGMKFGADLNASTSFDQTIYMIQVPTDSEHIVKKAFQILEDWSHNVSFENAEIDKERGVVIEEWRLGQGANNRMIQKQLPYIFKDSRYALRWTIGKKEIIESCSYETLKRFYKDWYRPELMAVVAVGDFDKSKIETLIKEHFSNLTSPKNPRERINYPIPPHDETLFAIASDKEAPMSSVTIYNKSEAMPIVNVKDYRNAAVVRLFGQMLSQRLYEIAQKPDAPFVGGGAGKSRFLGNMDVFTLQGYAVKDNKMAECLDVLLTEYERVKKYGFTQTELDREKANTLRNYEKYYNEKNKTESRSLTNECLRNFLQDEIIPGVDYEYMFQKKFLPTIKLEEVNALAQTLMTEKNRVIAINMPEKENLKVPVAQDLQSVIDGIEKKELTAYVDKVSNKPLIEKEPAPMPVVKEKVYKDVGITEWTLSNGVKVVLKPTDFKQDEILFNSTSPGGTSLVPDKDYISASNAADIISQSGAGNYNNTELQKYLSGKIVNVNPWIGEINEGIGGSCSPKDIKTMFQLIYSYFTSPRKDSTDFLTYKGQMKNYYSNFKASPEKAYQDSVEVTLTNHNIRRRPMNSELMDEIDFGKAYKIYKDRFTDASDFTFFFVGNFELDKIKPLIETYLGSLPSIKRKENYRDIGIDYPKGIIEKTVYKGIEPKSLVTIIFNNPFNWTLENNWELASLSAMLNIKLFESIRKEKSGTYGISVYPDIEHYPRERYTMNIRFGCDPARAEELTKAVFEQLDSLKNFGPKDIYITKVKETQIRTDEVNLKENRYWLGAIFSSYFDNTDLSLIIQNKKMAETLVPSIIQKKAQEVFSSKNYLRVVLYPETNKK